MTDHAPPTTLAGYLEDARKAAPMSAREAARRSRGIFTEGRWRQVVKQGEIPPARTIVAMALAVGADAGAALAAAGTPASTEAVSAIIHEIEARAESPQTASASGLAEEIERVQQLPLPPAERIRVAQSLIKMWAEKVAEPSQEAPE